ncbi:uncharacterized protein LOC141632747 [Silene latifolia]|uniref:uncharacterized protein LOC141632747 n=1 Tax=Silene latifolia TaxID=37657 RepID=UPI003D78145F
MVLKQGFPMFENKPLVVKPWTESSSMAKESVKSVPVWLCLCGLGLKFWGGGGGTLEKIATLVGKYMRADSATLDKTRLRYARLMVEVEVGQEFPNKIYFKDEKGNDVCVCVEYEWKPVVCGSCKGIGHMKDVCKKPTAAPRIIQIWRPVVKSTVTQPQPTTLNKPEGEIPSTPLFGGVTFHNSDHLPVLASPIIQRVRQEHVPVSHLRPGTSFKAVVSPTKDTAMETKIKEQDFVGVPNNLGGQWKGINNNVHHPGGRVWIIWFPHVFNVQLIADSDQHITVEVSDITSGDIFWLGREVTWNEIKDFRQCVEYCEVIDIVAHGSFFTWNNKQDPSTRVFSRIDRCLINIEWLQMFPDSSAYFMNEGTFDHCPCICYRRNEATTRKTSFNYFNMWSLDSKFKEVVATEWNKNISGVKMYQVVTKLRNLKKPLKELNKNKFSDIEKSTEVARVLLDSLQTAMHLNPQDQQLLATEQTAAEDFKVLNRARTKFLQQKAKV